VDLVYKSNGSLQIGIDQWADTGARSDAGRVPTDAGAGAANWRFFAVTYDSTLGSGQVKWYFGTASSNAALSDTDDYAQGAVDPNIGPNCTIGHFNTATRAGATDRMFRGLIDDIRIYGSQTSSGEGALSLEQIETARQLSLGGGAWSSNSYSVFTLSDVESFTNASSASAAVGTAVRPGDRTTLSAQNSADGLLARYNAIRAGADGDMRVTVTGNHPCVNALMLQARGTAGDRDGDGMPDAWEETHFGGTSAPRGGALGDWDGDGMTNLDEFKAGTSPTNAASLLVLDGIARRAGAAQTVVWWDGITGRRYNLLSKTNLKAETWTTIQTGIQGGHGNAATANVSSATVFLRIEIAP
jgi:hypothetical protein